jgi:hypothetical protein
MDQICWVVERLLGVMKFGLIAFEKVVAIEHFPNFFFLDYLINCKYLQASFYVIFPHFVKHRVDTFRNRNFLFLTTLSDFLC